MTTPAASWLTIWQQTEDDELLYAPETVETAEAVLTIEQAARQALRDAQLGQKESA